MYNFTLAVDAPTKEEAVMAFNAFCTIYDKNLADMYIRDNLNNAERVLQKGNVKVRMSLGDSE